MVWIEMVEDVSVEGRLAAIDAFLAEWFGPRRKGHGLSPPPGRDWNECFPRAMARWYANHGARTDVFRFNQIARPDDEWDPEPTAPPKRHRRLFMLENQAVYVWAYSLAKADDPVVSICLNEAHGTWMREDERLSAFLLQACIFECVMAGYQGAHFISPDDAARMTDVLPRLPLGAWRFPGYPGTFHAGGGTIGYCYVEHCDKRTFLVQSKEGTVIDELKAQTPKGCWIP
jgi:hypothetical protein